MPGATATVATAATCCSELRAPILCLPRNLIFTVELSAALNSPVLLLVKNTYFAFTIKTLIVHLTMVEIGTVVLTAQDHN